MLDEVEPLLVMVRQLLKGLSERGHLEANVGELVVEDIVLLVLKLRIVTVNIRVSGVSVKVEVHDGDHEDRLELEVPMLLLRLLLKGEGGVVDQAILEVYLTALLHFYHVAVSTLTLAADIENS